MWLSGLSAGLRTIKAAGSAPSQGTRLGCGPGPGGGHVRGNSNARMFLSLSSPFLPFSLKINKISSKKRTGENLGPPPDSSGERGSRGASRRAVERTEGKPTGHTGEARGRGIHDPKAG